MRLTGHHTDGQCGRQRSLQRNEYRHSIANGVTDGADSLHGRIGVQLARCHLPFPITIAANTAYIGAYFSSSGFAFEDNPHFCELEIAISVRAGEVLVSLSCDGSVTWQSAKKPMSGLPINHCFDHPRGPETRRLDEAVFGWKKSFRY